MKSNIILAYLGQVKTMANAMMVIFPYRCYQAELIWIKEEYGSNWYHWQQKNLDCWLCPAMLKYFSAPPKKIYCKAQSLYT